MHIKDLMQRGALCKGDVVIYKWLKEVTQAKDFFAPLRMVEFFMGFMISRPEARIVFIPAFKPFSRLEEN